ncbi:MAG TPA: Gfo/Idh/MocA family oxidoreductase [Crenalkalicoccus sp.]|jgi:predicted dehydrogenase|nr:Gfo/Idh/MocA family oxidoreductase [Crenalkalicoccus sp.]
MLKAAIVGMGKWGRTLVESVQGKPASRIGFVAGSTRTPEGAAEWAAAQGVRLLPSYEAVLDDPAVDGVVLATPHAQHAAQIVAAARAGKHVFVEKPFALTKASAEAAVAACETARVVLALGHNRRFLPAAQETKRLLASGELGTLLHVEGQFSGPSAAGYRRSSWRTDPGESPLGGMGGMGIHVVDMFIHLVGRVSEVTVLSSARALDNGMDDTTAALFRFASGATGNFATLALAARYWRVALFGSDGFAEMRGPGTLVHGRRVGEGWTRTFSAVDTEHAELQAFAAAATGGPPYPLPLDEAIHGVAIFETMAAAARLGRTLAVE